MQSNKIIIGIIVVLIIVVGYFMLMTDSPQQAVTETTNSEQDMIEGEAMMEEEDGEMMESEDAMMKKDDAMIEGDSMMEGEAMMESGASASAGTYSTYSPDKLALANSGDVVLFFKASWCPTCRALDADIKKNLGDIPSDVTILEVDYDSATALKQKYGVTTQHTLVQVDASGNLVTKWSGGNTLTSLTEKII